MRDFQKDLKLKDDAVQHTSVSNCFYYMVTIALSVKQIVWCIYAFLT